MKNGNLALGVLVATLAGVGGAGCDDLARALGECGEDRSAYQAAIADDGVLLESVPVNGPYPMALVLSQTAVNDLLRKTGNLTPPPIRSPSYDWGRFRITPTFPVIQIESIADCPTCVLADIGLDLWLNVNGTEFNGSARVLAGVPVSLNAITDAKTDLVAGLGGVAIQGVNINVEGFDTSDVPELEGLIAGLTQDYLRDEFGDKTLTRLDSFRIGAGQVFLAGRGPEIFTAQKTILIGMHSNLTLPAATTLEAQATLPEGTDLSLQFHPGLLLSMSERLLSEGEIPRDYDQDGNAADGGDDHVLLQSMSSGESGALRTVFRVWRTGGGGCGFVDVASDLALSITDAQVTMQAQNLEVVGGEGAGAIIAEASWLAGDFIDNLVQNLELTVNYRELGAGAEEPPGFAATSLNVDGRGVTVFLDLL